MDYITQADMEDYFGADEITNLGDGVDITQVIAIANSQADSYIGTAYTLPLYGTLPPSLKMVVADLARYYCYKDSVPDVVAERYKSSIRVLEQIAQGKVKLQLEDNPDTTENEAEAVGSSFTANSRDFTKDTMWGF